MYKLYKGSTLLKKVYKGSTPIKKIYKGSTLIWQDLPYDINKVIFEQATPGTYQVNLLGAGSYEVYCVAGGGRGGGYSYRRMGDTHRIFCGGGSGSAFVGTVKLPQGILSIIVGDNASSRNSLIGNIITTYGGGDPYKISTYNAAAGAGGAAPTVNTQIVSQQINSKGNDGPITPNTSNSGGASLFNGYGKGGDGSGGSRQDVVMYTSVGNNGYVKIIYKGE